MATRTLASARNYYLAQTRVGAFVFRAARRARTIQQATQETVRWQVVMATLAATAVAEQAQEQGLVPDADAPINALGWAGFTAAGGALLDYFGAASTPDELAAMALQQIRDVAASAHGVATAATPTLAGHIRYLNPPSCSRCTILAGRFYRYSEGFLRHENCDCVMVAVGEDPDPKLITNPRDAFDAGLIQDSRIDPKTGQRIYSDGLTKAQRSAIMDGADMAKVINVNRQAAGLRVAGRVLERRGHLTPEGIYQLASDRAQVIDLLLRNGYLK